MSRRPRPVVAVVVVLFVVLAGCGSPVAPPRGDGGGPDGDASAGRADPPSDRLGWEAGYWHDESVSVDQSDGLNGSERRAFVARTMARIEVLRGLEFERSVPVEVVSRAEFREGSLRRTLPDAENRTWNEQVWEALLLVGEDRTVRDVFSDIYGESVQGYYSPSEDRIVVVSDSPTPAIARGTLAHELVHALQDQRFGLGDDLPTQDAQLAVSSVVEGDARYVETLYGDRCGAEWSCVDNPPRSSGGSASFDYGVFTVLYAPYSEGPTLVDSLRTRGGWAAVNELYRNPPASTEQVVHPEKYPDERPTNVSVPDRSAAAWSRFDRDPAADTVGEVSLYATVWSNGGIDRNSLYEDAGPYSAYDYRSPVTAGWAGDAVVPYRKGSGEDATYGYVFRTVWDTETDAREFARTYRRMLTEEFPSNRTAADTWVIRSGPFADAFRVTRTGRTVTVVNAPTAAELDAVHRRES